MSNAKLHLYIYTKINSYSIYLKILTHPPRFCSEYICTREPPPQTQHIFSVCCSMDSLLTVILNVLPPPPPPAFVDLCTSCHLCKAQQDRLLLFFKFLFQAPMEWSMDCRFQVCIEFRNSAWFTWCAGDDCRDPNSNPGVILTTFCCCSCCCDKQLV